MSMTKRLSLMAGALLLASLPTTTFAQDPASRKVTNVTFSDTVQMPGFVLPAGTYRFSIADPEGDRRVIQVANQDGTKNYGMLLTIPDTRTEATDKPVVLFRETPAGTAPAVQTWFYPGERIGYELVYPKNQAAQIAKATHRKVLASDSDTIGTKDVRGAKIGRVDENGTFSNDDTRATSGSTTSGEKPSDRDKDNDRK